MYNWDKNNFLKNIEIRLNQNDLDIPYHWPGYRRASVLIPLVQYEGEFHFLLTKRTEFIATHKGQVSFPGGMAELEDQSPVSTALRETREEIGVESMDIRVIGLMKEFEAPNNLKITPVVGLMNWPIRLCLQEQEVSKVFTVPISWFMQKENIERKVISDQRGLPRDVLYYREYNGDVVWGITAHIINEFFTILFEE